MNCLTPASILHVCHVLARVDRNRQQDRARGEDARSGVGALNFVHFSFVLDIGKGRHGSDLVRPRDILRLVDCGKGSRNQYARDGRWRGEQGHEPSTFRKVAPGYWLASFSNTGAMACCSPRSQISVCDASSEAHVYAHRVRTLGGVKLGARGSAHGVVRARDDGGAVGMSSHVAWKSI